jgi:hypothetical protein
MSLLSGSEHHACRHALYRLRPLCISYFVMCRTAFCLQGALIAAQSITSICQAFSGVCTRVQAPYSRLQLNTQPGAVLQHRWALAS